MPNPWKQLMKNVQMSAEYGAAGARELKNPKLSGRKRNTNQSTIIDVLTAVTSWVIITLKFTRVLSFRLYLAGQVLK